MDAMYIGIDSAIKLKKQQIFFFNVVLSADRKAYIQHYFACRLLYTHIFRF